LPSPEIVLPAYDREQPAGGQPPGGSTAGALDTARRRRYSTFMELSNYAKIFKALSNEQRLKIFLMLYDQSSRGSKEGTAFPAKQKPCCAIEKAFTKVCECMDLSRSTISHHFKELQSARLITCERDGQMYRCRANEDTIKLLKDFLR
jgi:ArsR family transcriptional regulator